MRGVIAPLVAERTALGLRPPPLGNGTGGEFPFDLPTEWAGARVRWGLGRGRQLLVDEIPGLWNAIAAWEPDQAHAWTPISRGRQHNVDHLYLYCAKVSCVAMACFAMACIVVGYIVMATQR